MAILWAIIAKDLPEHHKMVSEAEKKYIIEHRDIVATEKSLPPWKRFLSHFSFYAIALQYFVVQFVIALFLIWLPTYLAEQYHVDFKDMAISSLPWLFMFFLILSWSNLRQNFKFWAVTICSAWCDCYRWICSVLCINLFSSSY